jgi:hypothetical protein
MGSPMSAIMFSAIFFSACRFSSNVRSNKSQARIVEVSEEHNLSSWSKRNDPFIFLRIQHNDDVHHLCPHLVVVHTVVTTNTGEFARIQAAAGIPFCHKVCDSSRFG